MYDIHLTEDEKSLKELARQFAVKELLPHTAEWDLAGEFPQDAFKKAFDMGLTTISIPEEYGGLGFGSRAEAVVGEELGYGDAGFSVSAGASCLGFLPVMLSGNKEMIAKASEVIVAGGALSFCLTEAEAGSDAGSLKTTAVKQGDEYIINGSKSFITNGGLASGYTVFASMDRAKGNKGIAAFYVERDRAGVSAGKEENKVGIRSSNTTEVIFDEVHVPVDHLLADEGEGFKLAMKTLNRTRAQGMSHAVGIMQRALDLAVDYANTRVTFGKPIAKNQAIAFMLADMEILVQASRTMVWNACDMADKGYVDPAYSSCVKAFIGDAVMKVTLDAVQIFGGYGYSREYPVEKLMRDAKIWNIFEGTAQIQRMTIASNLLKRSTIK